MNTVVILGFQISVGLLEVIILQIGAIILGFSIHFFTTSRNSMKSARKAINSSENEITDSPDNFKRIRLYFGSMWWLCIIFMFQEQTVCKEKVFYRFEKRAALGGNLIFVAAC